MRSVPILYYLLFGSWAFISVAEFIFRRQSVLRRRASYRNDILMSIFIGGFIVASAITALGLFVIFFLEIGVFPK